MFSITHMENCFHIKGKFLGKINLGPIYEQINEKCNNNSNNKKNTITSLYNKFLTKTHKKTPKSTTKAITSEISFLYSPSSNKNFIHGPFIECNIDQQIDIFIIYTNQLYEKMAYNSYLKLMQTLKGNSIINMINILLDLPKKETNHLIFLFIQKDICYYLNFSNIYLKIINCYTESIYKVKDLTFQISNNQKFSIWQKFLKKNKGIKICISNFLTLQWDHFC